MPNYAVQVSELHKSYGDLKAVNGISFSVEEGSFFAFLGPNGAGKSTTFSILCSLLKRDSGEVLIFGKEPSEARNDIGMVFQDNMLDPKLTVRENVTIRGGMYGYSKEDLKYRIEDALSRSGCVEFADRPYAKLSGGQRRRSDIARALVHRPKLLMLDEPTAGLDPQTRMNIWKNICDLKEEGMTVFLTTHYMEEATDADDVVIINKGTISAHGTPATLKEKYSSDCLEILPRDASAVETYLTGKGIAYEVRTDVIRIPLPDTKASLPIVNDLENEIESFEVRTGTLDEAFINITGGMSE